MYIDLVGNKRRAVYASGVSTRQTDEMSLADQLSRSRLRKVDKPKEPPSLLKELNAYSTVDLTKLRATSIPARRFDPSTDQWVPCDPASVSTVCNSFF
jgi:hypothetical protein